jgi:glyoxylase-like metal-dependent hydrolase (beta-lactamase superfamily II)
MKIYGVQAGSIGTNCYMLLSEDEKEAAIIDPAVFIPDYADKIEELGAELKYILLTHGHYDHTGGVIEFSERFPDAKLAAGRGEKDMLSAEANLMPDLLLKDDDELILGDLTLKIIETPGHTAGGISILVNNEVLFSGDTLFHASIGRTDFPTGDYDTLIRSIKEKLFVLDEGIHVLPGHMQETTISFEKTNNPFLI